MPLPFHTPLSAEQQRDFGLDQPQVLAMADQVKFSELDILKHVNNAVYMEWFERLRIRYTQDWGISRYQGLADEPRIVIRSGTIHYRQEMRMDEIYVVTCQCSGFRTNSYSLVQSLWSGGTLRASFECVLVHLTKDGTAKKPLPHPVLQRFRDIDGAHRS